MSQRLCALRTYSLPLLSSAPQAKVCMRWRSVRRLSIGRKKNHEWIYIHIYIHTIYMCTYMSSTRQAANPPTRQPANQPISQPADQPQLLPCIREKKRKRYWHRHSSPSSSSHSPAPTSSRTLSWVRHQIYVAISCLSRGFRHLVSFQICYVIFLFFHVVFFWRSAETCGRSSECCLSRAWCNDFLFVFAFS